MRALSFLVVLVVLAIAGCGKSRMAVLDPEVELARANPCVTKAEADRTKRAVRTSPLPRPVDPSRSRERMREITAAHGWEYWAERGEPRLECLADGRVRHPFGSVWRRRVADGSASLVAKDLDDPDGLLVVLGNVYVSTRQGLVRAAVDGSSSTLLPTAEPAHGRPTLDPATWTVYVQSGDKLLAVEP